MKAGMKYKVIFLLGAGASVEAGVSPSSKITDVLVNYSSYCPSKNSTAIENLLRYIQVRIAEYLHTKTDSVNFEYLLGTLVELSKKEESPIVPFLGEGDQLVRRLEEKISLDEVIDKLYSLLRELLYIRYPLDYLSPLKDFLSLSRPLNIFTLNYDLCLEKAFEALGIPYTTGYKARDKDLPIWDPSEFEKNSYEVSIYKLHGSIDWGQMFRYPPPPTRSEPFSDVSVSAESYLAHYPERVAFDPFPVGKVEPPGRSLGMVSTMNFGTRKELLYASSQFTTLFNHFANALHTTKTCIVAGYSFQDERINALIEEAITTRKGDLHLILANPSEFWITYHTPLLYLFRELNWLTGIEKRFGEALKDGSILSAVQASIGRKRSYARTGLTTPACQGAC